MTATKLMQILSENIRARRRELGMTQVALAEACKLPQPVISRAERGVVQLSLESLAALSTALRTTPGSLCTENAFSESEATVS